MNVESFVVALAIGLSASAATLVRADSRALADVPLPPGAVSRVVATDVVQNGRRTSIASLDALPALEDTIAFYRDRWPASDGSPGHLESRLGDRSILSRLDAGRLVVVELRETPSGPEGRISTMVLEPVSVASADPLPLPAGGQLLSSTSARDGVHDATTSIATVAARPGEVAAFYRDRLTRDGWTLVSDREHGAARVLLLDRADARLELVVSDVDDRSVVLANEVRTDG